MRVATARDERLEGRQLLFLTIGFLLGTSTIVTVGGSAARQDIWIARIVSIVLGICLVYLLTYLAQRLPGQSLIQCLRSLLGLPGTVMGVLYVWWAIHLTSLILRNVGAYAGLVLLPRTPMVVVLGAFAAVGLFTVRGGLEVIARLATVLVPLAVAEMLISILLLVPDMDPARLLPIGEAGSRAIFAAAFQGFAFPYGETVLFSVFLPAIKDPQMARRWLLLGVVASGAFHLLTDVRAVMALSADIMANTTFPALEAVRQIELAEFITRLDSLFSTVFLLVAFIKLCVVWYTVLLMISQLLGLTTYAGLSLPLGALVVGLAILLYRSDTEMLAFAFQTWPVYSFPFQALLPTLLAGLAWAREQRGPVNPETGLLRQEAKRNPVRERAGDCS